MIHEKSRREQVLEELTLPTTAARVVAAVQPIATAYDPDARLTGIVSGEDIDGLGEARRWEIFYDFPHARARAIFEIDVDYEGDESIAHLVEHVTPFPPANRDRLAAILDELWRQEFAKNPPLPMPFRDSPLAAADLARQGVDFLSGSTYLNLSTRWVEGEAVWEALDLGHVYRTPFAL